MKSTPTGVAMSVIKHARLNFSLVLILLSIGLNASSWTGDTLVCRKAHVEYVFSSSDPGPSFTIIPSYAGNSTTVTGTHLLVTWGVVGTYQVIVDFMASGTLHHDTLHVTVNPLPIPIIVPDGSIGCTTRVIVGDESSAHPVFITCFQVCDSSRISYIPEVHAGSTYQWRVEGAIDTAIFGDTIRVHWGAASSVASLTLYETNVYGCTDSITDCVTIQLKPDAHFTSVPAAINDTIHICLGSTVAFNSQFNDSIQNTNSWIWNFGDGATAQGSNVVTNTYTHPGDYLVSLIVESECHCRDTFMRWVHVDSLRGPAIFCPRTQCHFDTATYWTDDSCSTHYTWVVTGGTTVGTTDNDTIHVIWGDGNSGYGTVSLTTDCPNFCPYATQVQVPIVPTNAPIVGEQLVCQSTPNYSYTVPFIPSTVYTWSIPGLSGTISGQFSNQISVKWDSIGNDSVIVVYENAFLGCSGRSAIPVHVRGNYLIDGNTTACQGDTSTYHTVTAGTSPSAVNCNWTIIDPTNAVSYISSATSITPTFTLAGIYHIKASPVTLNSYCDTPQYINVMVEAAPPAIADTAIHGSRSVCPYIKTYTYTGTATVGAVPYVLEWSAAHGSPSSGHGPQFITVWNNSFPHWLLVRNVMVNAPFCPGPWDSILITQSTINSAPARYDTTCVDHVSHYTSDSLADTYQWALSDLSLGSVIWGQDKDSVNVQWNHTPGDEVLILTRTICGISVDDTIYIHLTPAPAPVILIDAPPYCTGQPIHFWTTTSGIDYHWDFGDGTTDVGSSVIHTFNRDSTYVISLTVTDPNNCIGVSTASTIIQVYPTPVAFISTPDETLCGHDTVHFFASIQNLSALGGGITYQWYKDGVIIIDSTGTTLTTVEDGVYSVIVTDAAGCSGESNIYSVEDTCPPTSGCVFDTAAHIWCSISRDCDTVRVQAFISTGGTISHISFLAALPDGSDYTVFASTGSVVYSHSGYNHIHIEGNFPSLSGIPDSCPIYFDTIVLVPLAPAFISSFSCDSTSYANDSIATTLNDISDYVTGTAPVYWNWHVNGVSVSSLQNPRLFLPPGRYYVTMDVGADASHYCTYGDSVIVPIRPSADFTYEDSVCEGTPVHFVASTSADINSYYWDFNDGSYSALNPTDRVYNVTSDHPFSNQWPYSVTLAINDVYGCRESVSHDVLVFRNSFHSINVGPSVVQCLGGSVEIFITGIPSIGGFSPLSYHWNTGATSSSLIVSETGTYNVTITDAHGCRLVAPPVSEIFEHPVKPVITGKTEYCVGEPMNLSIYQGSGYTSSWIIIDSFNNVDYTGLGDPLTIPAQASYNNHLVYGIITSSGGSLCADTSLPVVLTVHRSPKPPVLSDTPSGCIGHGIITLFSDTVRSGVKYPYAVFWSNGAYNSSIKVNTAGTYSAYAVDSFGCKSSVRNITINNGPDFSQLITGCFDFCRGDTFTIPGPKYTTSNAGYVFQWLLNGVPVTTHAPTSYDFYPVIAPGGVYQLVVTTPGSLGGCTDTSNPIDISFKVCDSVPCCCCGSVAFVTDSVKCIGFDALGHSIFDFSAYIYYPDSPSRIHLGVRWGTVSNVTSQADSTGILFHGQYTNTTDSSGDFCVKWLVRGLNGKDSCSFISCAQLPPCLSPCERTLSSLDGQICIDSSIYTIRFAYGYINYAGTPNSPVVFSVNVPTMFLAQTVHTVSNGTNFLVEYLDSVHVAYPVILTATIHDSIFGDCIMTFPLDTACRPFIFRDTCGYTFAMASDSCIGYDSLGNPIVHYTIAVTSPYNTPTRAFLYAQSLDPNTLTMSTNMILPYPNTTYITGTFVDTIHTGPLNFTLSFANLAGDSGCEYHLSIPNNDPCGTRCDSTTAGFILQICGSTADSGGVPLKVVFVYINYHGTPGSNITVLTNIPGQPVFPLYDTVTTGSYLPIVILDTVATTTPVVLTVIIHDSIYGDCIKTIQTDTMCYHILDSCIVPYASMKLDSCVGYDAHGNPIVHFTLDATSPFSVTGSIMVQVEGSGDVPNGALLTISSSVVYPNPTINVYQGTLIDTFSHADSIPISVIFTDPVTGTACGKELWIRNILPCNACPTLELLHSLTCLDGDTNISSTGTFLYIHWNGPNNTPFTLSSDCANLGISFIDSPLFLQSPGVFYAALLTDTFPYTSSCHLIMSVPGGCQSTLAINNLDTCLGFNPVGCGLMTSIMVVDSCIGIDPITGYPIFTYTLTISNPSTTFNSFFIGPDSPIVRFSIDGHHIDPSPSTTTYHGTFEVIGSANPIYFSYYIAYFDSSASDYCYRQIYDTLASPCPTGGGRYGSSRMFLYPNPTGTKSTLRYEIEGDEKPDMILITDLVGNVVMKIENLEQKGTVILDSEPLASSMYLVSLYEHRKPIISARWAIVR